MVLRLYHYAKEPVTVYNVIKVSIDDKRKVAVQVKEDGDIESTHYNYQEDYQRLTINVD